MRKKRAIRNFAGIIFLCLIVLVFTIISFPMPNSDYNFVGFARGIDRGVEYTGGGIISYEAYSTSSLNGSASSGLDVTSTRLQRTLAEKNYSANVYKTSNSSIKVEVAFNGFDDEFNDVESIINLPSNLSFKIKDDETVYLNDNDIDGAGAYKNNNTWGVLISFTSEGQTKFTDMSSKVAENSGTVEIYIGDTVISSFSISEKYENRSIFISGGTMSNETEAKSMADRLNSTKYKYSFKQVSKVIVTKDRATVNLITSAIIYVSVFALIVIALCSRYKKLGLCGSLALFIGALAQILLMMSLPNSVLTTTSFLASLLTMVIGGGIIACLYEKMRSEYALGKKIHASVKSGFTKNYAYILDFLGLTILSIAVLLIFGTQMAKYFAGAFLIGSVVYGLCGLLLSYVFAKWYVDINPARSKGYGFKREAHIDELN